MKAWLYDWTVGWFLDADYRDDPEHAKAMRSAWADAATQLGLRHSIGPTTFEDQIDGRVDGFQIIVSYVTDFDAQKPKTVIRFLPGTVFASFPNLDRESLLQRHDQAVMSCDCVDETRLTGEERAWLLGHRYGVGAHVNGGELFYEQYYWWHDSAEVVLVCTAMVKVLRRLSPRRKSQKG